MDASKNIIKHRSDQADWTIHPHTNNETCPVYKWIIETFLLTNPAGPIVKIATTLLTNKKVKYEKACICK